ncbi:carbohydrate-binding protein (plasmid) [Aliirhizobium terrae]|uniref:CBM35 domain-containing protein n=1 Tax=Terrirhizobium terrae TaxID=2926709 RepID=UPI0025780E04|nr:CBM35 domain-containing protein [Rhizobium sp. CC-CFT758]WJH38415.1 carbohydrate-binding protein [Rhizobium sp. CC-CFT758]
MSGTYTFAVTYANGGTVDRPLALHSGSVNGALLATLPFASTRANAISARPTDLGDLGTSIQTAPNGANGVGQGWEGWSVQTVTIHLQAGQNTLVLNGAGVTTGPNIDKFVITLAEADVPVNTAPVATALSIEGTEDTQVQIDVAELISDAEGDELTITATVPADQGTVSVSGTVITFTPAADFNGNASIGYTVTDADGLSGSSTVTVAVASVNDAPTLSGAVAAQNVVAGSEHVIDLPLTTDDVDGDEVSLVIANAGDLPAGFSIVDGKLVVAANVIAGTYSVAVAASDGTLASAPVVVSVVVAPAPVDPQEPGNAAPEISSEPGFVVNENTLSIGQVVAADDDGDLLQYALSGADAAKFTIDENGNVSLIAAPDFENPDDADGDGVYSATVTVSDGTTSTSQDITVTVADVNEAPGAISLAGTATFVEDVAQGTVLGTVSATDSDGDPLVYSVSDTRFSVNAGGQLVIAQGASFDFAEEPSVEIVVSAFDGEFTTTQSFTFAVTEAPEVPVEPVDPQGIVFTPGGLTPYSSQDSGPGGTISDGGNTLNLNGNFWKRASIGESYTITENTQLTLTVTLGSVLSEIIAVGFDDDELPFEMSDKSIYQIAGNQGQSSFVDLRNGSNGTPGQVITVTIDLSAHAGKTISSLVFIADDDQASNGIGSVSFSSVQLAEIEPENTAPDVVGGGFTDMSVDERGTLEVDLPFTDSDGDALSYTLEVTDGQGNPAQGFAGLVFEGGVLSGPIAALPGSYTVTVVATDGRGGSATSDFVLTVADINDAPVADTSIQFEPMEAMTGDEVSIDIASFSDAFSDIDGDALTFSVEGLPAGLSLNEEGVIVGTPTDPGEGFFTVVATDPQGLRAEIQIPYLIGGEAVGEASFVVEAEDFTGLGQASGFYASAAPAASGDQLIRANANQAGSVTTVLSQNGVADGWYTVTITVFDETDGNASFTLKIGDTVLADNLSFDDNGTFDNPSATRGNAAQAGNLKTITFTSPVFVDAATIAQISGQSDSGEYLRIDKLTLTPTEAPAQQAPGAITLTGGTVDENLAAGVVGTLSAIDPDGDSAAIVYTTTDERFVIEGDTIRLADGVSLDHEAGETVTVSVVATDAQGLTSTTELAISVGDVNEAPELGEDADIADVVLEAGEGTTIDLAAALGATDPDAGDSVGYVATLANGSALPTGISLAGGVLTVAATVAAGTYAISVAASDGALSSEPVTFSVTVGEPVVLVPFATTIQAETGTITSFDNGSNATITTIRDPSNQESAGTVGLVNGLRPGFSGTGYVDYGDTAGDRLNYDVHVPAAGTYTFSIRYASNSARPLNLVVNGGTAQSLPFVATGSNTSGPAEGFNNWAVQTVTVTLQAGTNTFSLAIPAGATTGPNIDSIEITGNVPSTSDTSADADEIPLFLSGPQGPLSGAGADSINFNLAGIDSDIVKVEMSFDGGATRVTVNPDADGDYTADASALAAGNYTAIAYVTDAVGNVAQSQMNFTIAGPVVVAPFTIQAEDATQVTVNDTGTGDSDTSFTREVNATRLDATGNYRAGANGGAYIDFGSNPGDAITFDVNAPAAGTYLVTFRYANGATTDRPLLLAVNGTAEGSVSFIPGPVTGTGSAATGWTSWIETSVEVTLTAGANSIRLAMPTGATGGPNIDQATFQYVDDGGPQNPSEPFSVTIEGETFTITDIEANASTPADTVYRTPTNKEPNANAGNSGPGQTFDSNGLRPGYEGTGYLDMGGEVGDKAGFNVTVEQAGTYQLTIRYANGGATDRPMVLAIGGVTQTISMNSTIPTGGTADQGWANWVDVTFDVQLSAGVNAISLANTLTNGPNIDNVTISREGDEGPVETRELIRFEPVVKINFEPAPGQATQGLPAGYQTPTGYLADTGAAYGDRGNGFSYGWVTEASVADGTANGTIAAAQPANAHWYKDTVSGASGLQKTYAHFEYPGAGAAGARAWEMALENGTYQVTMSIGDTAGAFDSDYIINLEGVNVMPEWTPANPINGSQNGGGFRSTLVTAVVTVTDGKLTMDSIGGVNTEIQYLEIERVPDLTPGDGRSADKDFSFFVAPVAASLEDGQVSIAIGPDGSLPTDIDPTSTFVVGINLQADGNRGPNIAYTDNIKLIETLTGIEVPVSIQISGGADTLNIRPLQDLKENTSYTLKVQDVMDLGSITDPNGPLRQFQDLTTTFVTGTAPVDVPREVAFSTDVILNGFADGAFGYTTIEFGPDGKLYVATITGEIHRWDVNANGTIDKASQETLSLSYLDAGGGERRGIVGFVFDPEDPNTIWISDNAPIPREAKAFNTPEFSGRVSKITLSEVFENSTAEAYINGLPRSGGDHLTNSLEFRRNPDYTTTNGEPEYLLYLSQGSNSAAGAADGAWGNRPERLLNAAILEIDPTRDAPASGFNVQTEPSQAGNPSYQSPASQFNADGSYPGMYNPYADDAVLKIYATGVRNAYDLVWHSNGNLYVPTNGTASGGKTPTDPTQPGLDTTIANSPKQYDYFFTVDEGGYYGHPNVLRDQYILNGGNPTGGRDPNEVVGGNDGNSNTDGYQTGVQPDANYDLDGVYNLGYNQSPNGAIEYTGGAFGSNLKGAVLFAQFSTGDNVRYIRVDAQGNIIGDDVLRRPDGSVIDDYIDPLDIIENPATGQLYLMTLNRSTGASQLILLTPAPGGVTQDLTADEGNDLALVALDVSDPEAAVFRIDGLDDDITAIRISFNGGPKQTITLNAQKQFTIDIGTTSATVTASIEVTDDALNTKTVSLNFVPGEEPSGEDFVLLTTIQAEDRTPNDGTSVVVPTGTAPQIQIRDASNIEPGNVAGTINGLRPGAYGTDGNTNSNDGIPGGYADFGSTNADFISFNFSVPADQAGNAILRFRYANGGTTDRPLQLEINGTIVKVQSFLPTSVTDGSDPWNNWQTIEIPVVLTGGATTVTLRSVASTGPNIDQLEVLVASEGNSIPNDGEMVVDGTTYVKYEAENADLGGAAVVTENRGQSGGAFVDYVGTADQSVSWTVSTATSGSYGLDILYALASTKAARPMVLSVNGVVVQTLPFAPNSNAAETAWGPQSVTLDLSAGTNVITLTAPGATVRISTICA